MKKEFSYYLKKMGQWLASDAESLQAIEILKGKKNLIPDKAPSEALGPPTECEKWGWDYVLFTDGGCRQNPGPGAWACVAVDKQGEILLEGNHVYAETTNNQMELSGVIEGLREILAQELQNGKWGVVSDSKYVVQGIKEWVGGWKARGWKKADGKTPENCDLWKDLDALRANFSSLDFQWVKGHSGHPYNEYCDRQLNHALDEFLNS